MARCTALETNRLGEGRQDKGAITSKMKHAIKHKTISPARHAQLLQPSLAFCFSLQPMTAYTVQYLQFVVRLEVFSI